MEIFENALKNIRPSAWKAFLISFIAIFLMVALPHLGITAKFNLISPVPEQVDPLDKLKGKLEQKENDFKLKKPTKSLIKSAEASSDFEQAAGYAVINFETGEVLAEKNLSEKLPIASITKVMTAVVALDLVSKDEEFTVSENASKTQATRLALSEGDKLTLEELLNALLLTSANDCAYVIQEGIDQKFGQGPPALSVRQAGDRQGVFIRAMNAKADFLGLKNTHFENPAGFDGREHISSPEDVAILSNYALNNYPLINEIVKKEYGELQSSPKHQRYEYLNNWNGLLGVYPGIFGVKIGNTEEAGNTTSVVSERDGKRIMVVLLGAPGVKERDLWASELLDLGFERAFDMDPIEITEEQLLEKYQTWKYSN